MKPAPYTDRLTDFWLIAMTDAAVTPTAREHLTWLFDLELQMLPPPRAWQAARLVRVSDDNTQQQPTRRVS